jgi:hypothetical protein
MQTVKVTKIRATVVRFTREGVNKGFFHRTPKKNCRFAVRSSLVVKMAILTALLLLQEALALQQDTPESLVSLACQGSVEKGATISKE